MKLVSIQCYRHFLSFNTQLFLLYKASLEKNGKKGNIQSTSLPKYVICKGGGGKTENETEEVRTALKRINFQYVKGVVPFALLCFSPASTCTFSLFPSTNTSSLYLLFPFWHAQRNDDLCVTRVCYTKQERVAWSKRPAPRGAVVIVGVVAEWQSERMGRLLPSQKYCFSVWLLYWVTTSQR